MNQNIHVKELNDGVSASYAGVRPAAMNEALDTPCSMRDLIERYGFAEATFAMSVASARWNATICDVCAIAARMTGQGIQCPQEADPMCRQKANIVMTLGVDGMMDHPIRS